MNIVIAKHDACIYEMADSVIYNTDKLKTKLFWKINPMMQYKMNHALCNSDSNSIIQTDNGF